MAPCGSWWSKTNRRWRHSSAASSSPSGTSSTSRPTASRRSPWPSAVRTTSSSSIGCCPTSTASPSCASCGPTGRRRPCSCSPPSDRSTIGSAVSTPGPTTTSPSRSPSRSSWPGSERSAGARRRPRPPRSPPETSGLDELRHAVQVGDRSVDLSAREFALLGYLIRHAGQVLTRQQILDAVWGAEPDVYSNVVDLYVHYLRRKLGELGRADRLRTVRGVGYTLRSSS